MSQQDVEVYIVTSDIPICEGAYLIGFYVNDCVLVLACASTAAAAAIEVEAADRAPYIRAGPLHSFRLQQAAAKKPLATPNSLHWQLRRHSMLNTSGIAIQLDFGISSQSVSGVPGTSSSGETTSAGTQCVDSKSYQML